MESTVDLETLLPSPKTVIVHEGQGGERHSPSPHSDGSSSGM